MLGTAISKAEVTHISAHGFWLLLGDEELLVPYAQFPWFKQATVEQILTVERPTVNHLHWPLLDIDLAVESVRAPDAYPLVSRDRAGASAPLTVPPRPRPRKPRP